MFVFDRFLRLHARALPCALAFFACAGMSSGSGIEDPVLRFSSPGPDCYADGSPVADGECYALVWSPAGRAFSGFHADGTAASPDDRVVLAAPLAKDGHCPEVLFQVPAAEAASLEGGTWSVCLVDTRTAAGVPAGTAAGLPRRVNRWAVVKGGVTVADASALPAPALRTRGMAAGVRAATLSAVPESAPRPTITAMDVAGGVAAFAVADTVPYLTYTVESSEDLDGFGKDPYADRVDGDPDAEIVLTTDAPGDCRFFRINRAE